MIQDSPRSGIFNMAADSYIADYARQTSQPVLRLYTWDQPTLSVGFHQKLTGEQIDSCRRHGVPIVRRPTGGRAVLHDQELTYALALPETYPLLIAGRHVLLKKVGEAFVAAAMRLGLHAELIRSSQPSERLQRGSALCFESMSRWEVHLAGRKWIGSAQRFLPGAFLQHGSILLKSDLLNPLTRKQSRNQLTTDDFFLIDLEALRQILPSAFQDQLGIFWQEENLCANECARIQSQITTRSKLETIKVASPFQVLDRSYAEEPS